MLLQNSFQGVWTSLVTPFATDGSVDWSAFDKILDQQISQDITGVVVGDTTGESLGLSSHEKLALIRRAKARSQGKMLVMAGSSGTNTQQVRELSRLCQDAGADCLLILTPPLIKLRLSGLVKHFKTITEGLNIGVFAEYAPSQYGHRFQSDELAEILSLTGVLGIKDDSGDLAFFNQLRRKTQKIILTGDDNSLLGALSQGADGVISVVSHVFPNVIAEIYKRLLNLDLTQAQKLFFALLPILESFTKDSNPEVIKACLAHEGLIQNELRLPLDSLKGQAFEKILANLNETKILLKGANHA